MQQSKTVFIFPSFSVLTGFSQFLYSRMGNQIFVKAFRHLPSVAHPHSNATIKTNKHDQLSETLKCTEESFEKNLLSSEKGGFS